MMKNLSALFFAVFYVLISIGFSVSVHHCSGMNETTIALMEEKSCCCDIEDTENNCCSNEDKLIQWDVDQQLNSNYVFDWQLQVLMLDFMLDPIEEESVAGINTPIFEEPPPNLRKAFLLFQQFTFYG